MATYPNTQLNLGQTSPANRNETYQGEGLYAFDREQTSFLALFNMAKSFVQNKNDASVFRDFYAGSVGSTLIELASGFSEFNSYSSIVARRESYLSEATLLDSSIGIAESLGYSTYRGENPKFTVTFTPTTDLSIKKFDIVGTVGAYDVISLENKDISYGEDTDLQIVIGTLKIAGITINDAKTYDFRFAQDKISEDIQIQLDGEIVPISNILYDLLEDKFVVLSNPVGGIDVRYLNRSQPDNWIQYNRYTFLNYVLPKYDWRPGWSYEVGDLVSKVAEVDALPILYVCTNKGTSGKKEPNWNEITNSYTQESNLSIRWQCLGRLTKQYYFRNTTPGIAISGLDEPIWLHATKIGTTEDFIDIWQINPLGQQVEDGNLVWKCTDTYEYSKYFYNTGSVLQLTYVELEDLAYNKNGIQLDIGPISNLSTENEFKSAETLQDIKRNAPLYNETRYVIRGREDYRKIFQILLNNCVDTNGFDPIPAVVELTYVKDHTNHIWTPDTYYQTGDEVMSTDGNGFIYRAISSGYGGISKRGLSGKTQPQFFDDIYSINIEEVNASMEGEIIEFLSPIVDNTLVWYPRYLCSRARPVLYWSADTEFSLHDEIVSSHPQIYFTVEKINSEPIWPTQKMTDGVSKENYSVQDNNVTWICIDDMYFEGYDFEYWKQDHVFEKGTYVQPVLDNGYFYLCTKSGMSGVKEPNWPITICDVIHDGGEDGCEWQCYDRTDALKYIKNHAVEQLSKYRQYGVSPCVITDPRLVIVDINFKLTTNENVDNVTIQNDLFNIIDKYQRKLNTYVDTRTLEEAVEELSYIMIARATITGNNKVQDYEEGHLYRVKDVVRVPESDCLYVANRIETGGYGYSQWKDQGYSGYTEPDWNINTMIGSTFKDGKLTWRIRSIDELTTPLSSFWEPDTVFKIGMAVFPSQIENPKFFCQVEEVDYKELYWPRKVGTSILDGRIYWTCVDPEKTAVPLGWDEYYMFNFSFTNERFYKK